MAAHLLAETFAAALAAVLDPERELPGEPVAWLMTIAHNKRNAVRTAVEWVRELHFPHPWRATTAKKSGDHAREISGPNTPIRLGYAARRAVSSYPAPLLSGPAFT